jgi:hypothetical protein
MLLEENMCWKINQFEIVGCGCCCCRCWCFQLQVAHHNIHLSLVIETLCTCEIKASCFRSAMQSKKDPYKSISLNWEFSFRSKACSLAVNSINFLKHHPASSTKSTTMLFSNNGNNDNLKKKRH